MSEQIKKTTSPIWGLLLTFIASMLLSCITIVMWRLRNASFVIPISLAIILSCSLFAIIYLFRKSSFTLALNRFIVIVVGIAIGTLLVTRTEESVMLEALLLEKGHILLEMPVKSSAFLEKCLANNTHSFYIAQFFKNTEKDFVIPILLSSYEKAKTPEAKLSILTMAAPIEDEQIISLFKKAHSENAEISFRLPLLDIATQIQNQEISEIFKESLKSSYLEEIMAATNYLVLSSMPEEELISALLQKIPILLGGLKKPEYQESIAIFISVFLGREALPQILQATIDNPQKELIDILARIGSKEASPTLMKIAKETEDAELRNASIIALGFIIGDSAIIPFLEEIRLPVEEDLLLHNIIEDSLENQKSFENKQNSDPDVQKELQKKIAEIEEFVSTTSSYSIEMSCKMWSENTENSPALMSEMVGNAHYQADNLFAMDLESTLQQKQKSYLFTSFDSEHQWFYIGEKKFSGRFLNKFLLKDFSFPNRPFDVWPIAGTGFMPGEDYLQTITTLLSIYDFDTVEKVEGEKIKIHGNIRKDKVMQYLANSGQIQVLKDQKLLDAMAKSHHEIFIFLQEGNVVGWEIISKQKNSIFQTMYPTWISKVEFSVNTIKRNISLERDIFVMEESAAKKAIDIGEKLAKIFQKRLGNREKAIALVKEMLDNQ